MGPGQDHLGKDRLGSSSVGSFCHFDRRLGVYSENMTQKLLDSRNIFGAVAVTLQIQVLWYTC